MDKAKALLSLILLGLLLLSGFYIIRKFYDSKHRIEIAAKEVEQLTTGNKIQNGDLIFQTSLSAQSKAIQLVTHSEYSHCGIIFKKDEKYFVLEAVQPVKLTPLEIWIARGKNGHYVIKRLKNSNEILTPAVLHKMNQCGGDFLGKNYDIYFGWRDDKIYCSELIWKIYRRTTGLEIGKLQKFRDFDLSNAVVKQKMKERYGSHLPLDEPVISPASLFNSELLITVKEN